MCGMTKVQLSSRWGKKHNALESRQDCTSKNTLFIYFGSYLNYFWQYLVINAQCFLTPYSITPKTWDLGKLLLNCTECIGNNVAYYARFFWCASKYICSRITHMHTILRLKRSTLQTKSFHSCQIWAACDKEAVTMIIVLGEISW